MNDSFDVTDPASRQQQPSLSESTKTPSQSDDRLQQQQQWQQWQKQSQLKQQHTQQQQNQQQQQKQQKQQRSVTPSQKASVEDDEETTKKNTKPSQAHLYNFLTTFKVEKGGEFTHTSFLRPGGSFYVPASRTPEFYDCYKAAIRAGEDLYVTEKHRHIGPVVADFDFRFDVLSTSNRRYGEKQVRAMTRALCDCVSHYVACPPEFVVHVMEKPAPVPQKQGNLMKDGVHIVIPGVVTKPAVQYLIRDALLAHPGFKACLEEIAPVNRSDDVVDRAVIESNNWIMYGSKKPTSEPYTVTHSYVYSPSSKFKSRSKATGNVGAGVGGGGGESDVDVDLDLDLNLREVSLYSDHADYVEELSIRNKYKETPTRDDMVREVEEVQAQLDDKARKRQAVQRVMMSGSNPSKERANANTSDCVDTARKMAQMLSPRRVENYGDWIRLGWCLRNIDHRLLDSWTEISQRSSKYIEGECETLWRHMRQGGLNIGTLHMWAKQDNPTEYKAMIRSDLFDLIHKSINGTHHDVARVVHHMYRYEYVCSSVKNRSWWEFRDHRWRTSDSAVSLRNRVSMEVVQEYNNMCSYHSQRAMQTDSDNEQMTHTRMSVELGKVALQLKRTNFKDNIIKECSELFYKERFEEVLDSNRDLLGFENGVYDLDNMEFREGRPDDHVSISTNIHYVPYDKEEECVQDVYRFFEAVHPNPNIRTYVLTMLASCLSGHIREEKFHIWTGCGSNGKSKVIDLFETAFGDYCCKLPVALLTGKRAAAGSANSEVARTKGKRFACLQEPSENERLNIGLMKEMTGGDKIIARALFSNPIEFRPMFKMALLCNHLPHVPSDDGGTWRRISVVEFKSKFVTEPPTKENEFPADTEIDQKFETWAPHFMSILIEHYRQYRLNGSLREPDEVKAVTHEYKKDNDHYADFIDTCLERSTNADEFVTVSEVFLEFKDWVSSDNIPMKVPKKKDVQNYLNGHIGKCVTLNGQPGYRGYKIRNRYATAQAVEDDDLEALS